ncbi:bifunctional DNA primase/polymerase [Ensifer sp. MJa1]|uniref:bifunctional DNA primase/polymerase n=1 Tax=Ensifer sp. MJa1 TaxID=2919888 RepID=UPI003008C2D3
MTMLDAALAYAARGWPVFPCKADKTPLVGGGFRAATTDEATIRAWWAKWPMAMIGLPTGEPSGLIVIDIDMKGEIDGEKSWNDLMVKHRAAPPITREIHTPSGGRHLTFRHPGNVKIRNSAGKLGLGLDVRGDGGYVIAPPSANADGGAYELFRDIEPMAMPEWLSAELVRAPEPQRQERKRVSHDADRWRAYGEAALRDACREIATTPEGRRNHTLNAEAFSIFHLVAGGVLGEGMARGALLDAARSCGLPEEDALRTIGSACEAGMAEPRYPPEAAGNGAWQAHDSNRRHDQRGRYSDYGADDPSGLPEMERIRPPANEMAWSGETADDGAPPEPLETFSLAEFAGKEVPTREFVDERHLVPCRNVTLLMGDGGTGKSLLALQLVIAVASGGEWLGIKVKTGATLYVSAEEDKDENHIRADAICAAEGLDFTALADARITSLAGEDATLAMDEHKGRLVPTRLYGRLALTLEKYRPALLALDNLADVFGGNEISRVQVKQFIGMLRKLAIKYDCAILLLGHPSLSGLSSGSGTSGSTAWSNSVRSRLYLRREIGQDGSEADELARMLETMKANYGPKGDPINLRWELGVFVCTDMPKRAGSDIGKADKAERVFMKLMRTYQQRGIDVSANPAATANYAPSVFFHDGAREGVTKPSLEKAMLALIDTGAIKVEKYGPPSRKRQRLVVVEDN